MNSVAAECQAAIVPGPPAFREDGWAGGHGPEGAPMWMKPQDRARTLSEFKEGTVRVVDDIGTREEPAPIMAARRTVLRHESIKVAQFNADSIQSTLQHIRNKLRSAEITSGGEPIVAAGGELDLLDQYSRELRKSLADALRASEGAGE